MGNLDKLTVPMSARFSEVERDEVDCQAIELGAGMISSVRKGRAAVLKTRWQVASHFMRLVGISGSLAEIQAFLSLSSLQQLFLFLAERLEHESLAAAMKFPPRFSSAAPAREEGGRLATGSEEAYPMGRQPLRCSSTQLQTGLQARTGWVHKATVPCPASFLKRDHFRISFAGRVA